jgi:hypothetical protein
MMLDNAVKNVLAQAREEIRTLRKENEIMRARWEGVDIAMQLLYATPPTKGGVAMGEDIAWKIDQLLNAGE